MKNSQMMEQEKSVLRWGGLSGILAGILSIIAMGVVVGLMPAEPATLEEWVVRFPEVKAIRVIENVTYLLGLILAVPLFLALAWALRKESLAPALFGSGLGIVGIVSMAASATPHVAHATLSKLYLAGSSSSADLATLAIVFQSIRGILDGMLYVGFMVVPMGHVLLAIGMLRSPDLHKGVSWASMVLGLVGLAAGILQMIDPSSDVGAASYLAGIVYNLIAGWSVYKLSKGK